MFPNINNVSLILSRKLSNDNFEVKLAKKQCAFNKDGIKIMIVPRRFKSGMNIRNLTQPTFRNESKESKSLANSQIEQKESKIINMKNLILLERLKFYNVSFSVYLYKLKKSYKRMLFKLQTCLTPKSISKLEKSDLPPSVVQTMS